MVIKHISKAELLVGYGDVEQAIAMLKDIESRRPDSIDVHVKLKDIYLRNEMIEEAGQECLKIASIYESRGDSERAMDFTVRAQRLGQVVDPLPPPPSSPSILESRPDMRAPEILGTGLMMGPPAKPRSSGDLRAGVETALPRTSAIRPEAIPPVELPPVQQAPVEMPEDMPLDLPLDVLEQLPEESVERQVEDVWPSAPPIVAKPQPVSDPPPSLLGLSELVHESKSPAITVPFAASEYAAEGAERRRASPGSEPGRSGHARWPHREG